MANYERNDPTNAKIIMDGDKFYLVDGEGNMSEELKYADGGKTVVLPENESNRKYYNVAKAIEAIEKDGECVLTYKPTVTIGTAPKKDPCEWAYKWLSEEKAAELKAIMDQARANMEAAKPVAKTKEEKLLARIAKMQAELDALQSNK